MTRSAKDIFQYSLAVVIIVGYYIVLWKFMTSVVPTENSGSLNILVGGLGTMVGMVVGYFFATSKSSAEKTAIIANSTPNNPVE